MLPKKPRIALPRIAEMAFIWKAILQIKSAQTRHTTPVESEDSFSPPEMTLSNRRLHCLKALRLQVRVLLGSPQAMALGFVHGWQYRTYLGTGDLYPRDMPLDYSVQGARWGQPSGRAGTGLVSRCGSNVQRRRHG